MYELVDARALTGPKAAVPGRDGLLARTKRQDVNAVAPLCVVRFSPSAWFGVSISVTLPARRTYELLQPHEQSACVHRFLTEPSVVIAGIPNRVPYKSNHGAKNG